MLLLVMFAARFPRFVSACYQNIFDHDTKITSGCMCAMTPTLRLSGKKRHTVVLIERRGAFRRHGWAAGGVGKLVRGELTNVLAFCSMKILPLIDSMAS